MTVTAYLFGFTLTMVFEGNKSEFARRMNIRRPDFNRIEQRLRAGSSSHEELMRKWTHAGNRMRIFKSAEAFLTELERCFCSTACAANRDCRTECPCKRFAEYMEWLHCEMERPMKERK